MCLGDWSLLGLVKDTDVMAVTAPPDVEGDGEDDIELEDRWDSIVV